MSGKKVSGNQLFAELYADIAQEVVDAFGKEGEEAIKKGVAKFGRRRGERLAEMVKDTGKKLDLVNYIDSYDMQRGDFVFENIEKKPKRLEQEFSDCFFAKVWREMGREKVGKLYCSTIDDAIVKGYREDARVEHLEHPFEGGQVCRLLFTIENGSDLDE